MSEPAALTLAITTRSGTTAHDPPCLNIPHSTHVDNTEETFERERLNNNTETPTTRTHKDLKSPTFYHPSKLSSVPFPYRLKKQKKDDEDERLLSIFRQIHVNLPFLEAMIHMPKGAKVLKDLLSHKEKIEKTTSLVKLNEECSAVIQQSLPQKEGDLGSFTMPCLIGPLYVKNALADLGASINLIPHSLFLQLGIFELKPTRMSIQLADKSVKYLIGVCENLMVKIKKFIFPVDFVMLEMDEDEIVPIILGRPFLIIAHTVIDVCDRKLCLRVRSETVTFNIGKSMRAAYSCDDYLHCADDTATLVQEQWVDTLIHDGK
ncbi:reverse transcriptase domain-containing protein [Tanacetum coccineum]